MSKTIILAMPYLYGLDRLIEKNLAYAGFSVINLCFDDRETRYPNLMTRAVAFYHKKFKKSLNYKKRIKYRSYEAEIQRRLAALGGRKADYALCFRADAYPKHIIADIRRHSEWCVNYQWDGMHRFGEIFGYLPYFDRFFVFDQNDVDRYPQYPLRCTSNFYFDFPKELPDLPQGDSLYFVGGIMDSRTSSIQAFAEAADRAGLPLDFYIAGKKHKFAEYFNHPGIHHLSRDQEFSFGENLRKALSSRALVDFVISEHEGLSFRVFDALKFDKKLITTNTTVKKYDFYHPDNIHIWNENEPFEKVVEFLNKPLAPIPAEIKVQYSFSHWLDNMLAK
ncbi:hypothetical protein [Bergeriella denitrificans]|uniref:Uncharacterized protein conserved in bacteria n=1 Tax=Bergeriella denitrificans TaxID=494 RepID=A0A378ULV0_BERDE|nr:hypothetical protein [Bergeriella denitrificans]STZ77452.1 Uncharacterized protein conserved in bacteria [Bergeriella denitrificans]